MTTRRTNPHYPLNDQIFLRIIWDHFSLKYSQDLWLFLETLRLRCTAIVPFLEFMTYLERKVSTPRVCKVFSTICLSIYCRDCFSAFMFNSFCFFHYFQFLVSCCWLLSRFWANLKYLRIGHWKHVWNPIVDVKSANKNRAVLVISYRSRSLVSYSCRTCEYGSTHNDNALLCLAAI